MRAASSSPPLSSSNDDSQTFTYDLPETESDINMQPWDPDYSYTHPEGTGLQVKLPADIGSMSAQTKGKQMIFFLFFFYTTCCIFQIFSTMVWCDCGLEEQMDDLSVLLSNLSPTPSSQASIHEVNARLPGCPTFIPLLPLLIPEIHFRPVAQLIKY